MFNEKPSSVDTCVAAIDQPIFNGRWTVTAEGGVHLDLRGADLSSTPDIDEVRLDRLAAVLRGLTFCAVDAAKSGHPGGSSSKAEMLIALLASGHFAFDP